jgi:glycosyltransferase involved in cell wall biosynthesis
MLVSIILCTYRSERYEDFVEALDSLNAQSYENEKLEIVVVVDGNRELYDRILKRYKTEKNKYLKILTHTLPRSLLSSYPFFQCLHTPH